MPTLLLATCATQRPSSGTRATDWSRMACSWPSACCSASGAGPAELDDADADELLGAGRAPVCSDLPPESGVPVAPEGPGAGLSVAAAVSVGVAESRCHTNQPPPATASRTTATITTISAVFPPGFGGSGWAGGCGGHGGGVGTGPVGAQPTGVSGQAGVRGGGMGAEPPGGQAGSCCGGGWYGFTPIPRPPARLCALLAQRGLLVAGA